MSYYDNDFYNEPSEFEQQVDELKESLSNAVKDEFKAEMERLRKEIAELQGVKKDLAQIKRDYDQKAQQLELERSVVRQEIRRERLSSLMKDFEVILYTPNSNRKSGPKCDKCDKSRKIPYKTPLGKSVTEDCDCNNNITYFEPRENVCSSFSSSDGEFRAWYKPYDSTEDYFTYDSSDLAKFIYSGEKFEDLKEHHWRIYFRTKEDCQSYCDWLTEKEANKLKEC
ncbi:hypothetical protein BJP48_31500 [Paenibacillus odorifer]|nr:hypothetical protein BJP48_31500 [Paenibacillus odorifer]